MKKFLKSFIYKPKIVALFSLVVAISIGIFGYFNIHKIPANQFTKEESDALANSNGNVSTMKNLSLGFLSSGRIKDVLAKTGNKVKKGDVLASLDAENAIGVLAQARASYNIAEVNYQKIMNGATGTVVDVAKAAVHTAEVGLNEIAKQQETLVDNAYRTLLNSSLQAQSVSDYGYDSPTVSGTYGCKKEGFYDLSTYSSSGVSVDYSGIEKGILLLTDVPRPLGGCGLFLSFDKNKELLSGLEFKIQIPNTNAANYNTNNNAYQLALQTKEQMIAGAQATLDQAKASLNQVVANARPEDVATALAQVENASGLLQIAEASYKNTTILAPGDGIINAVYIAQGQIAVPNTPAIEFLGSTN